MICVELEFFTAFIIAVLHYVLSVCSSQAQMNCLKIC